MKHLLQKSSTSGVSITNVTFVEAHSFLTKTMQESLLLGYELEYIIFGISSKRYRYCGSTSGRGSGGGFSESCVGFVPEGAACWISAWEDVALLSTGHCLETRNITACRKLQIM